MELLNSQKNALYKIIEGSSTLTPNQFELKESIDSTGIVFKGTNYFFSIKESDTDEINIICSPGNHRVTDVFFNLSWMNVISKFYSWIEYLEEEISSPNLWDRLNENIQSANISTSTDNSQFTISEYEDLKTKMIALQAQMKMLPFLAENQAAISEKLDHLIVVAEKLSKFDWTNLFIGTIMNIVVALALSPENTQALWNLIRSTFKGYFLN